jgi:hypothetical protein
MVMWYNIYIKWEKYVMNIVKRSKLRIAAENVIANPSLLDQISDGPKVRGVRHELNNYKHDRSTIDDVENALAWCLGFDAIEDLV